MSSGIISILTIQDTIFISLFNIFARGLSMGMQITIESDAGLNYVARELKTSSGKTDL